MHLPINVKSPNNISKWQVGFNSAFKGLNFRLEFLAAMLMKIQVSWHVTPFWCHKITNVQRNSTFRVSNSRIFFVCSKSPKILNRLHRLIFLVCYEKTLPSSKIK
jgi:hypothetical protein